MAKTKTFYAVMVFENEWGGEIKANCETRELAEQELKKYRDFYQSDSPKPDDKHILKLEMIVE